MIQKLGWLIFDKLLNYNILAQIKKQINSQFKMNRKQSHEPIGSHSQSYHQKSQYQPNSPYIELLDNKRAVYGYRYDTKNVRSFTNYVKPSPASISSIFYQKAKPFKSTSTEKVKIGSYTNDKKKRTRTEQAQEKMHESMCIYPSNPDKTHEQNASKSLFYPEPKPNAQFQPNQYFQQLTGQKNKRKRHLSQNKHNHSSENNNTTNLLENLQISDIDGLINLIDNCVSQANQYIAYLSDKMNSMKEELLVAKAQNSELEQQINKKNAEIMHQGERIKQLEKKTGEGKDIKKENGFEVKNLLQIIEKMSQQNQRLRSEIQQYRGTKEKKPIQQEKIIEKQKDPRCDYYNQIHSKIDILNISIDNNHNFNQGGSPMEGKQRADRDTAKKYKFIKPKGR